MELEFRVSRQQKPAVGSATEAYSFRGLRGFTTARIFPLTMCIFHNSWEVFADYVQLEVFAGCEMHDDASLAKIEALSYIHVSKLRYVTVWSLAVSFIG